MAASLCSGLVACWALLAVHGGGPALVSFESGAAAAAAPGAPGAAQDGLVLVVAPHPDDELTAWAGLADTGADSYTVFLTLTRGESTRACREIQGQVQQEHGERAPRPSPVGVGHPTCGHARLDSWWSFLEAAGGDFPAARTGPAAHVVLDHGPGGRQADVWVGERGARVARTLPDGAVGVGDAASAVTQVLDLRGDLLPDLPVTRIVAATYWNDSGAHGNRTTSGGDCVEASDCPGWAEAYEYEHADHRRTAEAMVQVAADSSTETWVVVPPGVGAGVVDWLGAPVTATVRAAALPARDYEQLVQLLHQHYGWLSYPDPVWTTGQRATAASGVLFARQHDYLVLPGSVP